MSSPATQQPSPAADSEAAAIARELIACQGYCELVAAHLFGSALRVAPSLDEKMLLSEQLNEELEHFELLAALYASLGGDELLAVVADRASSAPIPETWVELAVAQTLFECAAKVQLRGCIRSSVPGHAKLVAKILAEEEKHGAVGETTLRTLLTEDDDFAATAQGAFDRWLLVSLGSFWDADAERSERAVELELTNQGAAPARRAYLAELTPMMSRCALRFPSAEQLGDFAEDLPKG
jgi:1,2-phenylacetyl-CoA epoxidase catalytic subunit